MTPSQTLYIILPAMLSVSPDFDSSERLFEGSFSTSSNPITSIKISNSSSTLIESILITKNRKKIQSFKCLEHNWNSYGAEPFDLRLLEKADGLLFSLNNQPKVFPTGRGSVQFEYEKSNGDYLEFEIFIDKINFLKIIDGQEEEGLTDENKMIKLIDDFYA